MAFISDISARQQASLERERLVGSLEDALSEKTVLLKRVVHHRVKNNLAVIAGLLDMQAAVLDDPRASRALAESEQRGYSRWRSFTSTPLFHRTSQRAGLRRICTTAGQRTLPFVRGRFRKVRSDGRTRSRWNWQWTERFHAV